MEFTYSGTYHFEVNSGEVFAILGANGAGKTTLLETVAGLNRKKTGKILLRGERIDTLQPIRSSAKGIALVPEGRQLFPRLTVLENLHIGAYHVKDAERIRRRLRWSYRCSRYLKAERTRAPGR